MASPILFEVEGDVDVGFAPSFELADDNLPRELETGVKLRKTVTRYAGTYTSVQVHGEELKPIELEGVFDDTWTGDPGGARALKEAIEAIVLLGEIVRFEYEEIQLWGTLDCEFKERGEWRIEYKLIFEPFWRADPRFEIYVSFAEPPNDLGESLDSLLAETDSHFVNVPDGIDTSFVGGVYLDILSARNRVSNVLGYIEDVGNYAELTAEIIGLVSRSLFGAARSLDSAAKKLLSAGDSILDDTASAKLRGGQWIYTASRLNRSSLQALLAMLRKFLETREPRRVRLHSVRENDTLQRLAQLYLGDFARWVEIADANNLTNTELVVGQSLRIPPR